MTKNILTIILPLFFFCCSGCIKGQEASSYLSNNITEKLFDNFIELHPDTVAYKSESKSYKWNYEQGLILEAFYRMWEKYGDEKYFNYVKKNIDYYVEQYGNIKTYNIEDYNLDNILPGRILLHLYSETGEEKYRKAADILIKQLQNQPRTIEGGFWHKKRYPYQMWLDGIYMAEPFYVNYAALFNEEKYFDDIATQFLLIKEHCKDEKTGLYYHGWDESKDQGWADPETGHSPSFWGRSIGWFMMALVDVLDSFPEDHPDRGTILNIFKDLSEDLLKYRDDENKLWYQVVDKGELDGNYIETSSSLMFIYSFAKGALNGYLPEKYFQIAAESFKAIINNYITIDEANHLYLQNTVSVGGLGGDPYRDGSFEYYVSEPLRVNDFKGYGALLLAATALDN